MNDCDHMMARMAAAERRLEAHETQVGQIHGLVREIRDVISRGLPDSEKHSVDHEFLKILKAREERRIKLWQSVVEKATGLAVIAVSLAVLGAVGRMALDALAKVSGGHA